jgi:hypothetical protein
MVAITAVLADMGWDAKNRANMSRLRKNTFVLFGAVRSEENSLQPVERFGKIRTTY